MTPATSAPTRRAVQPLPRPCCAQCGAPAVRTFQMRCCGVTGDLCRVHADLWALNRAAQLTIPGAVAECVHCGHVFGRNRSLSAIVSERAT